MLNGVSSGVISPLRSFLAAAAQPAYEVALPAESTGLQVVWRNDAAHLSPDAPPSALLSSVQAILKSASQQKRHQLDATWSLTIVDEASAILEYRPAAPPEEVAALQSRAKRPRLDLVALLSACEVPNGVDATVQRKFLETFAAVDWAATDLGDMATWSPSLIAQVTLILVSPTPILFAFGSNPGTMVYNYPYSVIAGAKHPRILGQRYDVAWPEVWPLIKPFVDRAYSGSGTYYTDIQMFLERDGRLEETYFFWYMAPVHTVIDGKATVNGVWIPNAEVTPSVVNRRRLRFLNSFNLTTSSSNTLEQYWSAGYASITSPEIQMDIPLACVYATASEIAAAHSSAQDNSDTSSDDSRFWYSEFEDLFHELKRRGSDTPEAPAAELHRVTPPPPGVNLPSTLNTLRQPVERYDSAVQRLLRPLVNRLRAGEKQILLDAEQCALLFGDARSPVWTEDRIRSAVVCSLQPSQPMTHLKPGPAEDSLDAIAIFALNTRRPYDAEYADFIRLLCAQLTAGHLNIKTLAERVFNAQYVAWATHQQHADIKIELARRTKEWQRHEAHFTRIFEACPAGVWLASGPEAKIQWVNDAWYNLSGIPRDAPADTFFDYVVEEDREAAMEVWNRSFDPRTAIGSKLQTTFRWKGLTSEGLERWTTSMNMIDRDEDGYPSVTGVLQDLSHLKYAEEIQRARADDAVQRKRNVDGFIDLLSHELRNPLGAISSGVELVSDRLNDAQLPVELRTACQDELNTVSHCLSHIHRLVDETLHMSKTEHDLVNLVLEEFQPEQLARQTLRLFQSETNAKSIGLALHVGEGIRRHRADYLISDHGRIGQILINLLTNAVKFVADRPKREIAVHVDASIDQPRLPGRIAKDKVLATNVEVLKTTAALAEVSTSSPKIEANEKVFLRFDVQDTGVGLDEEQQKRLFVKWEQAMTPKTERTYGGSGLGLYFCRKLAALLDGRCGLQSEAGVGSTFSFYVTCRRAPAHVVATPPVPAVPAMPSQPDSPAPVAFRVLLVEDNLINQRLLAKQLSRAGCIVTTADDGQYAINALLHAVKEGQTFDACAMDVEMPRLNGLEATRRIRELEADGTLHGCLPIIGVSANARAEQQALMHDAGMTATVVKPFKIQQLLDVLRSAVG